MTPQRWQRLQHCFERVLRYPRSERQAALWATEAELEDESLRHELRRLIEHAEPESDFLRPLEGIRDVFQAGGSLGVGDVLGDRFEIVRFIGRGGMGEVFEAFDRKLHESVAIKTIASEYAHDAILLQRFQREVQLARRITHRNVCRIHDFGDHQGIPYFTMEILRGETLPAAMDRGALGFDVWEQMARQLFEGLRAAHQIGVFHRDLKPSNLMLIGSRLVILDFGLARPVTPVGSSDVSRPGMILGTPDWMAPEMMLGEGDHRSDLYSAALVLVHAITGSPSAAKGQGLAGIVSRVIGATDMAKQLPDSIPPQWRRSLLACLALDPKQRPESAEEVLRLLDQESPKASSIHRLTLGWQITLGASLVALALLVVVPRYLVRPELKSGSTIVMVPTRNVTDITTFDAIGTVMNSSVAQSAYFNVWSSDRLPAVLRSMRVESSSVPSAAQWREVAFREHAGMLCFSTLGPIGSGFSLAVECEQVGSTPTSPLNRSDRVFRSKDRDGVHGLVFEASDWIRTEAGEGVEEVSAKKRPPQDITSPSWEALQLFEQAREARRLEEAVPLLERALQKDPQFAMALMMLADYSNALNNSEKGYAYWKKAIEAAKEQRLSNRERLSIESRYAIEIGDYASAEPVLREWVKSFPNDIQAKQLLAVCLMATARAEEGVALAKSTQERFGPSTFGASLLIRGLGSLNRPTEMEEQARVLESISAPTLALRFRGMAAAMKGDYSAAEKLFSELVSITRGDEATRSKVLLSYLFADQGRFEEALHALEEAIAMDAAEGRIGSAARKAVAVAYLEGENGRHMLARAMAQEAVAQDPSPYVIVQAASVLARNGYPQDAERVMNKFTGRPGTYFDASRMRMQGEILLSRGRHQEAVEMLDNAVRVMGTRTPQEFLARALVLAGQRDRARILYQRIAKDRWYIWGALDTAWPGVRFRAELYSR